MDQDAVLNELDRALLALKVAGESFDQAMDGLRQTIDAIKVANHAQLEAIEAVIAATRAARRK